MLRRFLSYCCPRGGDTETLLTSLEEQPDYDDERVPYFDFLPDEVILHIFSFLTSGQPLLDAVPLVCRRWHRLSRDPQAWSGVEVWLTGANGDDDTEARVLLRAPALARLELLAVAATHESALRRGTFVVLGELDARGLLREHGRQALVDAVVRVAWRSRRHLRVVNLHLGAAEAVARHYTVAALVAWLQPPPPVRRDPFRVLAGLDRVRELHLSFPKEAPLPYRHRLAAGLRGLRVLTVDLWWDPTLLAFLEDALRLSAPSLRVFRVWLKSGRANLLEAVAQCAGLRGLFVLNTCGGGLQGLRRLQRLADLRLMLYSSGVADALDQLADARDLAYDLPELKKLWITFVWNHYQDAALATALAECAAEFAKCRPQVISTWNTV